MGKPDNQKTDIETLIRQLRRDIDEKIKRAIKRYDDELKEDDDGILYLTWTGSGENPEDDTEDDDDGKEDKNPVKPFIQVKFRNNNGIFTKPTESNSFGEILTSSDGTVSVNVRGTIEDKQSGIEKYKIRIKRID